MNQYSVNTVETFISSHPINSSLLKRFANEKQTTGVLLQEEVPTHLLLAKNKFYYMQLLSYFYKSSFRLSQKVFCVLL